MNDNAWHAFLDTLAPDHRDLAQKIMVRINTILNSDRQHVLNEVQRSARRSDKNAERIGDLAIRLDTYEQQRAADVRSELERFAREQLSKEESDRLISVLYNLATRVERLEGGSKSKEA